MVLNPLSSANHPDSWLTIGRQPTVCLSECYNEKPDNLTVFLKILDFTENQRYGQLLLISTLAITHQKTNKRRLIKSKRLQAVIKYYH